MSLISDLSETLRAVNQTTRLAAEEAVAEEREVTDTILGVNVVLKYEGTQGRGTVMVYSGVFLDGERFGTEYEVIPWSIFKDPHTRYSCGEYMLKRQAEAIIKRAKVTDVTAVEEPYPTETGPVRYHFQTKNLESVVKLWKTLKKTKLSDL